MEDNEKQDEVKALVAKAAQAHDSGDAVRFSQAACNAANALYCIANLKATWPRT